jgi:hypothetical protein
MVRKVLVYLGRTVLYFALIENRSFLTSKNSGSQFNRSIAERDRSTVCQ